MRLGVYGAASTALAGVTLQQVYTQRGNFYAAGVYLAKSNACLLILLNFGVFLTILLGKALQRLFFGQLRMIEVEVSRTTDAGGRARPSSAAVVAVR